MRLPRDLAGEELARRLSRLGSVGTRQTGRHLALTTQQGGEDHLTIPLSSPLRGGTLAAMDSDVPRHVGIWRDEVLARLWD